LSTPVNLNGIFESYSSTPASLQESGFSNHDAILFQVPTKGRRYGFPDVPNGGLCALRILQSSYGRKEGICPRGRAELLDVLRQRQRISFVSSMRKPITANAASSCERTTDYFCRWEMRLDRRLILKTRSPGVLPSSSTNDTLNEYRFGQDVNSWIGRGQQRPTQCPRRTTMGESGEASFFRDGDNARDREIPNRGR
jgi:hypothetical protein